jgi:hypothetical protein
MRRQKTMTNKNNDALTEFSIQEKKQKIQSLMDDGLLDKSIGLAMLADQDKAMSKAGSSMTEISPTLSLSTPVCVNDDNKEKGIYDKGSKQYVKHFIKGVKGGHVVLKGFSQDGADKYTCYPPLDMVMQIINNADLIREHLAKKAGSGHIFKKIGTTRVEQLSVTDPADIIG